MLIDSQILMPPGFTLQDMMEEESVSAEQLSDHSGIPLSCLQRILDADHSISEEVAHKLQNINFGAAGMWLNMQSQYEHAHNDPMDRECAECYSA